jgi:hypothetical protein
MDEESRRERILSESWGAFPGGKAGSKGCRKTPAEACLLQKGLARQSGSLTHKFPPIILIKEKQVQSDKFSRGLSRIDFFRKVPEI